MMDVQKYILRYAAGLYWVIKKDQQEAVYTPPLQINECGAFLWKGLEAGYDLSKLSQMLQEQYGVPMEEAKEDVRAFVMQLSYKGILTK